MRIGKRRAGPAARPRPIKAVFSSGDARHLALKRGKDIRARGFGIGVDLTISQQQVRNLSAVASWPSRSRICSPFGAKLIYRQVKKDLEPTALHPNQPTRSSTPPPSPSQAPSGSATILCSGSGTLRIFEPPQAQVLCLGYQSLNGLTDSKLLLHDGLQYM